ncbi:transposase [Streptomyces griseoruber]|uniref:transposase n=1 Tax=Streptomyces griseoruber TaxID=1943 RepID=UPI0037BA772C
MGHVTRFPTEHHSASHTGTAPLDASSGKNTRHRLNTRGKPSPQLGAAHGRCLPDSRRRPWTGVLPAQDRRGLDTGGGTQRPQTTPLECCLSHPQTATVTRLTSRSLDTQRRSSASPTAPPGPGAPPGHPFSSVRQGGAVMPARRPAALLQDRAKHSGGNVGSGVTARPATPWCSRGRGPCPPTD